MTDQPDAERAVAIAMFTATGDETDAEAAFDALEPEDREQMLAVARVAMSAHMEWLLDEGFRVAPPGMMLRPKSDKDAHAMIQAARDFLAQPEHALARRKGLLARPKLIVPGRLN